MVDSGSAKQKIWSKVIIVLVLLLIVLGAVGYWYQRTKSPPAPASLSLAIPFTTQAPDGNWTNNENCEEASSIMVNAFLSGNQQDEIPLASAQQQIAELVAWEQANLGFNTNTGATETAQMISAVFHLQTKVLNDFSEANVKAELAQQHPVILFINARLLNNPNYNQLGPTYHVVVVRGYDSGGLIVNDPGLDGGKNNHYSFAVLKNAAADWNSSAKTLDPNKKVALTVFK